MNEVIREEDSIKALREMAQQLLDLLVLADMAQIAEARLVRPKGEFTTERASNDYAIMAALSPKWIRDELDWETFPAFLRPR
ncbi:hypothetical protein LCGC14_2409200 [marine sediment metagenome]|uniref:Uncharacterized protein n=1 Tax=marine sediment metagenome TaxID=412755 RepID=A0A0F9E561_9ZZZZ